MRVLLIEDDNGLREALSAVLQRKGLTMDRACDIAEAQAMLSLVQWDAVLLDLHLPDGDGLSLIPLIRERMPHTIIMIVSARDQITDRIRGLDAGADDYIVKPFDPDELMARMRAVERRLHTNGSSLIRIGSLEIDLNQAMVRRDGELVNLTAKEWGVLRAMASHPDRVLSKEQLFQSLYNFDAEVGSNTLEVFIYNLRRKLATQAIQTTRGMGYRLTGD